MLFPPIDPNERFASVSRFEAQEAPAASPLIGSLLAGVVLLGAGARFVGGTTPATDAEGQTTLAAIEASGPRTLPVEIRGST